MKQYNFTFYITDPMTDEVIEYTEKTIMANSKASAERAALKYAQDNGWTDFEEDE